MDRDGSFLPEDYVTATAERRTNLLSLALFGTVMIAVFGAFLVTNRQWTQVRTAQVRINGEMEKATEEIRKMRELERRRGEMVEKAELATTLVEPVPRSVLLALLVAAMPERLSLVELDLRSDEVKVPRAAPAADPAASRKAPAAAKVAARGKVGAAEPPPPPKPEPSRYLIALTMTGLAADDLDVSRFMHALGAIPILKGVRLDATESKDLDGRTMRQFRISCRIEPDANVRRLAPGELPVPGDPLRTPDALRQAGVIPTGATGDER